MCLGTEEKWNNLHSTGSVDCMKTRAYLYSQQDEPIAEEEHGQSRYTNRIGDQESLRNGQGEGLLPYH